MTLLLVGEGEPPEGARKWYRKTRRQLKGSEGGGWGGVQYTVLGLGDTNYTNFCNFGKDLDGLLHSLAAKR